MFTLDESPEIMTKTTRAQRSSNAEFVRDIIDKHSKWLDADAPNRKRLFDSMAAFMDIDGGAWPEKEKADLLRHGRHPTSFNIAEQKLNSLAGNIMSEKWEFDFLPLVGEKTSVINGIKHWYYADREQYNYSQAENKTLMRGLIHVGYEGMDIRHDIRPTGAITFFSYLPGQVIPDPYWQTDNYKDWKRAMVDAWLSPQDILDKYETNDPRIKALAGMTGGMYETYEPTGDVRAFETSPEIWGSTLLVTEYRWIEKIKTTRLYLLVDGEYVCLPSSLKGESEVRNVMAKYGIESFEMVKEYPYEDNVLRFANVCPNAMPDTILSEGKHPVQCGSIGIFPFTATRESGVNKGAFEAILDIQRTLNYRESKKDDIIASTASGAMAVNVDALPNGERDLGQWKEHKTRPDAIFGVHGDPSKIMARLPTGEVPESILQDISSLIDMMDRVTPVTPALEGRGGGQAESGIKYRMTHAVSRLGTMMFYENWMQHQMNKAEAWYYQAAIQYKGLYKKVLNKNKNEIIEFNAPAFRNDQYGHVNSVDELPRAQVIVTLKKESPTLKIARQMEIMEQTKILAANPELFKNQIRILVNDQVNLTDRTPEEKAKIERIQQMEEIRDMLALMAEIENIKATGLQAKLMQEQTLGMLSQLTQGMAQGGGGMGNAGTTMPTGGGEPEQESFTPGQQEQAVPTNEENFIGAPGQEVQTRYGNFQP